MKNLKKVLALALAFAMAISMFASAAFTDAADISAANADDVAMLVELGVLGGYPDGSFKPQNTITRAEFTKMAYTIKYGSDDQGKLFAGNTCPFTDVAADHWAKGYINYCANQGIVGGIGNNKFDPNGNVTVAQVAKMLLVILGADASKEGYGGANWMGNVVSDAMELGVFDGWVGDPTAPATRELVATLMANTVFAPTYVYNPLTGVGSQTNPLDPSQDNQTLGEKTMGLKHVEGIVVANDTAWIEVNEDGKTFEKECGLTVGSAAAEDEITILVENNDGSFELKDIEVDAGNDVLGTKVDVYYTVKNGKTTILGDVIVSADSVVYELTASDIEIMPNGESGSTREIVPYISVKTADKEFQVRPRNGKSTTVPANVKYEGNALLDYFFFSTATKNTDKFTGELVNPADIDNDFYKVLGEDSIQAYRAVSLDGGKTISYIFRTATKDLAKVTTYSAANDNIAVSGFGTISELAENVVFGGEIAKGDQVIAYYDAGMLYVDPTVEVTGKADIVDDNEVTIGDANYKADLTIFDDPNAVNGLANYYRLAGNNNEATKYITYNGYILDVEGEGVVASLDQYAAVLASSYDADLGAVKVRLAFADESVATYTVGKVDGYKMTRKTPISYVQFQNNAAVGNLYRYTVAADGSVNLFTDTGAIKNDITAKSTDGFDQGNIIINGNSLPADDNSVVFMLYGGCAAGASESDATSYEPIEALVYKIAELPTATAAAYGYYNGASEYTSMNCAYVASNDNMKTVIAATMPMGKTEPTIMPETDNIAYLVEAKYGYDYDNYEFFADVTMVTAEGLVEAKTVGNINAKIGDTGAAYGGTPKTTTGAVKGEFVRGAIIEYALDANGVITALGLRANPADMAVTTIPSTGFAYATIANVSDKNIAYYAYSNSAIDTETAPISSIKRNKYEFEVIAIDDGDFVDGGEIETVGKKDTVSAGAYNAIVQTRSGEVVRIFSIYGNI